MHFIQKQQKKKQILIQYIQKQNSYKYINIQIISNRQKKKYTLKMFKQIQSQTNIKPLKKTKLYQISKNTPTIRTKIMLTDLCIQQKAKIGDLVRTLQSRKIQNQLLQQKQKSLSQQYQHKISQLYQIIQNHKIKQDKYLNQITILNKNYQQKNIFINNFIKQQSIHHLKQKSICVDQFALTQQIITNNQSSQTSTKKKKQKAVQTQSNQLYNQQTKRYPNNSKSFQKIMKNNRSQSGSCSRDTKISRSCHVDNSKHKKNNQHAYKQSQVNSQLLVDYDGASGQKCYNEQGRQQQKQRNQNQIREQDVYDMQKQQQNDDCQKDFNQLAQKWMNLKQKNMSKIRDSYQKSKQKIHNINTNNYNNNIQNKSKQKINNKKGLKSIDIPKSFNIAQQQQQKQYKNYTPQIKNILQDNQSFGPKIPKQFSNIQLNLDQDFDQIQLNKILKLKNFSASKLLNQKNNDDYQKNMIRKNSYNGNQEQFIGRKKSKLGGNTLQTNHVNSNNGQSNSKSKNCNNMDFYQTDLLDIVTSISKPS